MGLDGRHRASSGRRDLGQGKVAEEAQEDDLAIRLVERRDGPANGIGPLGFHRDVGRVGRQRGSSGRRSRQAAAVWLYQDRIEAHYWAPAAGPPERNPHRNPAQPGAKRPGRLPAGERAIGDHECLLGCVFGFVEVAQDPVAGADDGGRLAIDEDAKGLSIAAEHEGNDPRSLGIGGRARRWVAVGIDRSASASGLPATVFVPGHWSGLAISQTAG